MSVENPSSGRKPWWYTPHPTLFFVVGALFLAQGVVNLVGESASTLAWFGYLGIVLGGFNVAAALLSRRRDRLAFEAQLAELTAEADVPS